MSDQSWQDYFQPGETLLWEGAPAPGVHGLTKIIGIALFGMPFLIAGIAIAGFGITGVFTAENLNNFGLSLFLTVFSVPFVGIGAFLVFGQWYAAHKAHLTIRYALTTRAAYIAQSLWKRSIDCYPILPQTVSGIEKGKGVDTVWFHVRSEKDSDGDRTTTRVGFEHIADGERAFRLLRQMQTLENK